LNRSMQPICYGIQWGKIIISVEEINKNDFWSNKIEGKLKVQIKKIVDVWLILSGDALVNISDSDREG